MRKLKLLALALVIGAMSSYAVNLEDPGAPKEEIRNQIVKILKSPDFAVDNKMKVEISFTFSSEGEIVVLRVESKNRDVLNYIRENLNYKKIENPGTRDKIYTMPLTLTHS